MIKVIGIVIKRWLVVEFIPYTEDVVVECVISTVKSNIQALNKLGLQTGTAKIMIAVKDFSKPKKNAVL